MLIAEFIDPALAADTSMHPSLGSSGAAGLDVRSPIDVTIPAGGQVLIPLGFRAQFQMGFVVRVASRSGLMLNHRVRAFEGVIDSDYRGEYGVILINDGAVDYQVRRGDRIAQLLMLPCVPALSFAATPEGLSVTERGSGGFGSSGL